MEEAQVRGSQEADAEPESDETVLPVPAGDRPAEYWEQRAEMALRARALGLKLRKGKRLVFSSRHHLAS